MGVTAGEMYPMRQPLAILRSTALAAAMVAIGCGAAVAQGQSTMPQSSIVQSGSSSFSPQQRREIVEIIRSALKSDPSILRDAVTALQSDDGARQQAAADAAVSAHSRELLHSPQDPVMGNPAGDVTLVEFFDVRCPYCRQMLPVIAELVKHNPNLRVVLKDIPILGPASLLGARAELAAEKQGGYQKLHDQLMSGTPDITQDVLHNASQRAGLDWDRLQRDMTDPTIQTRLDANLALARALQIQGTPAYIVGHHLFPGAVELADLQTAVSAARVQ
jgi:protein-disulfide isomerase